MKNNLITILVLAGMVSLPFKPTAAEPAPAAAAAPKEFVFDGGDLPDFVDKLNKTYKVNLFELATIGDQMRRVRVPKMRLTTPEFQTVLRLYNSVSDEGDGTMGKWIIKYANPQHLSGDMPNVLVLTPGPASVARSQNNLGVRAFPFRGLSEEKLNVLREVVEREASELYAHMRQAGSVDAALIEGNLRYHKNAGILVASGGGMYMEMASAVIEAFRQAEGPPPVADIPITTNKK